MANDPGERARELFERTGLYCAESVLLAVAEHEHIESELIPRIATGLCSGMARTGGMCGAVSGGVLAIGLVLGRSTAQQPIDPCYTAVREFMGRFADRFGSLNCAELTGVQLGTPEGQAAFLEKGQFTECANYVAESARLIGETISRFGKKEYVIVETK